MFWVKLNSKKSNATQIYWLAGILALLTAGTGWAQQQTPLQIGCTNGIEDEFNQPLPGSLGAPGDLVQVLWASNGIIYAPATDGTPDPRNPLVENGQTAIGALTAPSVSDQGYFGHTLFDPRPDSGQIFVRVFNAPHTADASFYGDSQIHTIDLYEDTFLVALSKTDQPLDPADNDHDGLNNSWEKSYASDPNNPDTDGDGFLDGDEIRAGTGIKDPNSLLQIVAMVSVTQGHVTLTWDSVADKKYLVQYTEKQLSQDPVYTNLTETAITATNETTQYEAPGELTDTQGHFRILLDED